MQYAVCRKQISHDKRLQKTVDRIQNEETKTKKPITKERKRASPTGSTGLAG
jgi:hypothetical protein